MPKTATRIKRKKAAAHVTRDDPRSSGSKRGDRRSGGARRDRTDDLLLAKQALSQLSYGPFSDQRTAIRDQTENV